MFALSKPVFKAQFTMKVMLEVVLILVVYSQIYPTLIEPYLETAIEANDPVSGALLSLIPFVIAAIIVIGIISFNIIGGRRR